MINNILIAAQIIFLISGSFFLYSGIKDAIEIKQKKNSSDLSLNKLNEEIAQEILFEMVSLNSRQKSSMSMLKEIKALNNFIYEIETISKDLYFQQLFDAVRSQHVATNIVLKIKNENYAQPATKKTHQNHKRQTIIDKLSKFGEDSHKNGCYV